MHLFHLSNPPFQPCELWCLTIFKRSFSKTRAGTTRLKTLGVVSNLCNGRSKPIWNDPPSFEFASIQAKKHNLFSHFHQRFLILQETTALFSDWISPRLSLLWGDSLKKGRELFLFNLSVFWSVMFALLFFRDRWSDLSINFFFQTPSFFLMLFCYLTFPLKDSFVHYI